MEEQEAAEKKAVAELEAKAKEQLADFEAKVRGCGWVLVGVRPEGRVGAGLGVCAHSMWY